jgi:hypothetical protein
MQYMLPHRGHNVKRCTKFLSRRWPRDLLSEVSNMCA